MGIRMAQERKLYPETVTLLAILAHKSFLEQFKVLEIEF